ncbi:hypothetical protein AGMMS49992_31450 [Clostridia bacterium]|nr:hypothetical protein AGMMS49992_31450 [Clostridia bacterium]
MNIKFIRKTYRTFKHKVYYILFGSVKYAAKIGVNFVQRDVKIYGKVSWGSEPWIIKLGKAVHITDGVKFITHDGGVLLFRDKIPDLEITKPITIGDNVYIGNNVILLPGVNVGNNVVIGAGAVVTKDIPNDSVSVGVPARVIKTLEDYYLKIRTESIHLGNLYGEEKDNALKNYYGYKGKHKGIYW